MAFFDFLKRKNNHSEVDKTITTTEEVAAENTLQPVQGIEAIYAFLQADYESRGYNDALISPDESYRSDNIKLLKRDLEILIQQVTTYYEDMQKDLDFHILSRSRAGLIDLVEELKTRKEKVDEHMAKVQSINSELTKEENLSERIVLSYQRGFMRGLSAITKSNFSNKQL